MQHHEACAVRLEPGVGPAFRREGQTVLASLDRDPVAKALGRLPDLSAVPDREAGRLLIDLEVRHGRMRRAPMPVPHQERDASDDLRGPVANATQITRLELGRERAGLQAYRRGNRLLGAIKRDRIVGRAGHRL